MMKVHVKSFAHLRLALRKSPVTIEIPEHTTVAGLIRILIDQYGATAREAIWKQDGQTLKIIIRMIAILNILMEQLLSLFDH